MNNPLWISDRNLQHIDLSNVKLVSCDIFDTLLFRTTSLPLDVFSLIGTEAKKRNLIPFYIHPNEYRDIREAAEKNARKISQEKRGHAEVTLADIYQCLPQSIGDLDVLLELELELEKKCLFFNPSVSSLLTEAHNRGIPVVLLSDMYLNQSQLTEILQSTGFDASILNEIIVSSEYGCNKWNKGLYNVLFDKHPFITPNQMIHIGDNYLSDVQNARELDIQAIHYKGKEDEGTIFELERLYGDAGIGELLSLRKLASLLSGHIPDEERFWFEFGATVIGPFVSLFSEWIVQTALDEKVRNIYPLMREGGLLTKTIKASLAARGNDNFKVKPIYISRKSTFLPCLPGTTGESLVRILANEKDTTVQTFFNRLNLTNPYPEYTTMTIEQTRHSKRDEDTSVYNVLCNHLLNTEVSDQLASIKEMKSTELLDYLTDEFQVDREPFMTVDIGYSGTMQRFIDQLLNEQSISTTRSHLIALGSNSTVLKRLQGTDIRSYIYENQLNEPLSRPNWVPAIIEILMMDAIGSTLDYSRDNCNLVVPVLEQITEAQLDRMQKERCHQGVLQFHSLFTDLIHCKPWITTNSMEKIEYVLGIFLRFMEYPTTEEAQYLGDLHHENAFEDSGSMKRLCSDTQSIWLAGALERDLPNYHRYQLYQKYHTHPIVRTSAKLATHVLEQRQDKIIVYGVGKIGSCLIRLLQASEVHIAAAVDSNRAWWGKSVENVPVYSLADALQHNTDVSTIVIASTVYQNDIQSVILEQSNAMKKEIQIISL